MRAQDIETAVQRLDQTFPDGATAKFVALLIELEKWNRRVNLTAIRDPHEMISAHILDSLVARPFLEGSTVLDVGTGPGFPGYRSQSSSRNVNSRCSTAITRRLCSCSTLPAFWASDNVVAVKGRGEDYAPGQRFDTVIARALAALPRLLEIAGHHVGEDGVFVALKGRYPAEELEQLSNTPWGHVVTELKVPGLEQGSRHAVLLRRD